MPIDPTTSQPLPETAIQRQTFTTPTVHIYAIPPLASNTGFSAGPWTAPPRPTAQQIFTARLKILETSLPSENVGGEDKIKVDIVLEDSNSGELFAAAPYTTAAVVQQANDSSRFFAIRVVGEGGMKATLGLGFEDRAPALDFNIALGEARKVLGVDGVQGKEGRSGVGRGPGGGKGDEVKQDWSLKEGEKIHIQVGSGKGRKAETVGGFNGGHGRNEGAALFSIAPPPGAGGTKVQAEPVSNASANGKSAQDLGFDDGEFGEFV